MKVVIAGTRYKDKQLKIPFDDYSLVCKAIARSQFNVSEVVSGDAIGVDRLGEQWAITNNIDVHKMPATAEQWRIYGKAAGVLRNGRMADYADAAVVIWDGVSPGTYNMIQQMIKREKPHFIMLTTNPLWGIFNDQ